MQIDFRFEELTSSRPSARQEWVIDGIIPQKGLTVLYGPPGSFKSFVALDLALSAATQRDWNGMAMGVVYDGDERSQTDAPTVYIATEGPKDVRHQRIPAWLHHHGMKSDALKVFRLTKDPIWLRNPSVVEEFIAAASDLPDPPVLLVIDTLSRMLVDGDENSPQHMLQAMAGVHRLQNELDTAVIVIHHTGKDAQRGPSGSNVLLREADTVFRTAVRSDELRLVNEKQRTREVLADFRLRPQLVTAGDIRSLVLVPSTASESVRAVGSSASSTEEKLYAALAKQGEARSGDWERVSGVRGGSFNRAKNRLLESGRVIKRGSLFTLAHAANRT